MLQRGLGKTQKPKRKRLGGFSISRVSLSRPSAAAALSSQVSALPGSGSLDTGIWHVAIVYIIFTRHTSSGFGWELRIPYFWGIWEFLDPEQLYRYPIITHVRDMRQPDLSLAAR